MNPFLPQSRKYYLLLDLSHIACVVFDFLHHLPQVDNFADANIDFEVYKDDTDVIKKTSNFYVYNNLLENKYIAVDYYKGIYVVSKNSKYKKIEIFEKEKYTHQM